MTERLARVRCHNLEVPYTYPIIEQEMRHPVNLVEVETESGVYGYGLASYPMRRGIREFVNHELDPEVRGMDPRRTAQIRQTAYQALSSKFTTGLFACAMSLVDIALWDVKGQLADEPVWQLLGGGRDRAPVYATFGLPAYDDGQLVEAAKLMVSQGHNRLKMAIAAGTDPVDGLYGQPSDDDLRRDVARVYAVRDAVGPDVEVMIDANKNITYAQALWLAQRLEEANLAWFEDPLPQGDPRLLAQLRRRTSIPLAAGSTGTGDLMAFREYLVNESVDIIQPNVRDIGGLTGGIKAAAIAEAFNATMAMGGNWPHINLHLHGAVSNGGLVEVSARANQIAAALFEGTVVPTPPFIEMPRGSGLGYRLRSGVVDEYTPA